jgi:hypothetical protein
MRSRLFALVTSMLAVVPGLAAAQQIDIETRTPQAEPPAPRALPRPEIVTPPGAREITRPREADFQPQDIRVRIDPAFIEPFTAARQTGPKTAVRFGLAGWTAPQAGVHQAEGVVHESQGVLALGLSIIWDVPVEPVPTAPKPAAR